MGRRKQCLGIEDTLRGGSKRGQAMNNDTLEVSKFIRLLI